MRALNESPAVRALQPRIELGLGSSFGLVPSAAQVILGLAPSYRRPMPAALGFAAREITRHARRIILVQLACTCVALFGIAAIVLFIDPSLLGVPLAQRAYYVDNVVWLATGLLFVCLGTAWIIVAGRRSRRAIQVYRSVQPLAMLLKVEVIADSDSTTYYALLRSAGQHDVRWRVWIDAAFDIRKLSERETPVRVYVDPDFKVPAVIESALGLLWANPFDPPQSWRAAASPI